MSKYAISDNPPSELFTKSLRGGGSSSVYCNCGRTHYAPSNLYNSEDEEDYDTMLNECLREQRADPDGIVIDYENDFVRGYDIDGKTFVDGCPCNGLRKYEDWIWNNKDVIRDYLVLRVNQECEWALEQKSINKLKGFV